jgi:hypothetical protein
MPVNPPRQGCAAARDKPRQGFPYQPRQGNDRRIRKKIPEKGFDRVQTIWTTQIEKNNSQLHDVTFKTRLLRRLM